MQAGDLKHRITFQKNTPTTNADGYDVPNWQDYKTVWAAVKTAGSRELFTAMAQQSEISVIFTVRYAAYINDLDSAMHRIVFHGKIYNIKPPINDGFANRFLTIAATEGVNNG